MQSEFPDINLLPGQYRSRAIRVARVSVLLLLFALLTLLPLALVYIHNGRAVDTLQANVQQQRYEAAQVENMLTQRESTLTEITSILRRADTLEQQTAELARQGPPVSSSFQVIGDALPPRVTITEIHDRDTQMRIFGRAGSASLVVEFAQSLEESGSGRQVVVDQMQQVDSTTANAELLPPGTVTFSLVMEK